MPVQKCPLTITDNRYESVLRGIFMFPCGGYVNKISDSIINKIPWHWHEEVEVLVVCKGTARLCINETQYILCRNEGAFINSNVLHSVETHDRSNCLINSLVFNTNLISGTSESIFEQRYIKPLLNCSNSLQCIPFYKDSKWGQQAVQSIKKAYKAYKLEEYGFELIVRECLSHMWYLIIKNNSIFPNLEDSKESQDGIRIKTMMNFVHLHYDKSLNLNMIASSANISERECLRCFKKTIGTSPMQYLLKYRISVSVGLLLDTNLTITEICMQAGFESPSYFTKVFKQHMSCTPTSYRKEKHKIE